MKSKMWKKIFKNNKSTKSATNKDETGTGTTSTALPTSNFVADHDDRDTGGASCSTSSHHHHSDKNSNSKSSKLSKMVNSFTLKRHSNKENNQHHKTDYNAEIARSIIRNTEIFSNNYPEKQRLLRHNNNNIDTDNGTDYQQHNNFNNNKRQIRISNAAVACSGDNLVSNDMKLNQFHNPLASIDDMRPLSPLKDLLNENNEYVAIIPDEPMTPMELKPCPICSRKFIPNTLNKHVGICEKMATKKRKTFDSSRQRREGTELAAYLPKNFGLPNKQTTNQHQYNNNNTNNANTINENKITPKLQIQESTPIPKRSNININNNNTNNNNNVDGFEYTIGQRQNSSSSLQRKSPSPVNPIKVVETTRNNNNKLKVVKRSLAPPQSQCPSCSRSFGIKAFDRHVEWCKEKTRVTPAKNSSTDLLTAKERLAARTQYRAPNFKAKREAIRTKYSGFGNDDNHSMDGSDNHNFLSMSNSLSSSFISDGHHKQNERKTLSSCDLLLEKSSELQIKKEKSFNSFSNLKLPISKKSNHFTTNTNTVPPIKQPILDYTLINKNSGLKLPKVFRNKPIVTTQTTAQETNSNFQFSTNDNESQINLSKTCTSGNKKLSGRKSLIRKKSNNNEDYCNENNNETQVIDSISEQLFQNTYNNARVNQKKKSIHSNMQDDGDRIKEEIISLNSNQFLNEMSLKKLNHSNINDTTFNIKTIPKLNTTTNNSSLRTILPPINRPSVSSICSDDELLKLMNFTDDNYQDKNYETNSQQQKSPSNHNLLKKNKPPKIPIIINKTSQQLNSRNNKNPSNNDDDLNNENFWMNLATNKQTEIHYNKIQKFTTNSKNMETKSSGYSDKYDPFMSAKRQLEELCSPTTTTTTTTITDLYHKNEPNLMTTSLNTNNHLRPKYTKSLSTSYNSSTQTPTTPTPTPISLPQVRNVTNTSSNSSNKINNNFRRTSSLRSPRKPNIRPLFVPPSRSRPTTIQRGISDEGPISTNFIKTEEYDEMPVKSACINNFATSIIHNHHQQNSPNYYCRDSSPQTKLLTSPRSRSSSITIREPSPMIMVIKRDANTNINRRNLRLNFSQNNKENENSITSSSSTSNNAMNPLLKTDSLAVFLKYENELNLNPIQAIITPTQPPPPPTPTSTPTTSQEESTIITPITEKDWKDQNNIYNKQQNSIKNYDDNDNDKLITLKNSLTNLFENSNQKIAKLLHNTSDNTSPEIQTFATITTPTPTTTNTTTTSTTNTPKHLPIKLEPLPKLIIQRNQTPKIQTPISSPLIKNQQLLLVTTTKNTPTNTITTNTTTTGSALMPIFPFPQIQQQQPPSSSTAASNLNNSFNLNSILKIHSKSDNFIDPKLINICDNLQIHSSSSTTTTTTNTTTISSSSSGSSSRSNSGGNKQICPINSINATKLTPVTLDMKLNPDSLLPITKSVINTSVSSPPSVPIDSNKQISKFENFTTSTPRNSTDKKNLLKRQIRLEKNQFLYDDNDGELSSSNCSPPNINSNSNDTDQTVSLTSNKNQLLPLIGDNEKQFDSLLSPSNNPIYHDIDFEEILSSFTSTNNSNNSNSIHLNDDEEHFPGFKDYKEFLMNQCLNMRSINQLPTTNQNNFIIPSIEKSKRSQKLANINDMMMNFNDTKSNNLHHYQQQAQHKNEDDDDDDDVEILQHNEHEIFISIETDQNDNETLNPCPNDPSIKNRNIEEIHEHNDNQFTKIETHHLPICEEPDESFSDDCNHLKNQSINLNNNSNNLKISSTNLNYPLDSDEFSSSVECFPSVGGCRSIKTKASYDSGYASLSRQSPISTDRSVQNRINSATTITNRLPIPNNQSTDSFTNNHENLKQQQRHNRRLSGSSSSSEQSLPPINSHQQQQQQHPQHQQHPQQHHNSQNSINSNHTYSDARMYDYTNELLHNNNRHNHNSDDKISSIGEGSTASGQITGGLQQSQPIISKFCHECGSRFLITQAKFCMECGVKRIILE